MSDTHLKPEGFVQKAWGGEFIFANNNKYCGKILTFTKDSMCSMHFHSERDETWYVLSGEFIVKYINTETAEYGEAKLSTGDIWRNLPLFPHQLMCIEEGVIVEASSPDNEGDTHRVIPGDGQKCL